MSDFAIGIDLGGTKTLFALVSKKTGEVLKTVKKKNKSELNNDKIMEILIEGLDELFNKISFKKEDIVLIGIGGAGQIDKKNGEIIFAPNLNCKNLNLKNILEKKYNIPVFVDNDVNVATIGEMKFGSAKGCDNCVCVFVGTGVGAALVINGKIFDGISGTAGELGHTVIEVNGRKCNCGKNGCLEAYASRTAIEKRIKEEIDNGQNSVISQLLENKSDKIRSSVLKTALELEDKLTFSVIDESAKYLACALSSVINFLNPEKIILGGGVIEGVEYFYHKTIEFTKEQALMTPLIQTTFEKAFLGDFAGVIGACFLDEV